MQCCEYFIYHAFRLFPLLTQVTLQQTYTACMPLLFPERKPSHRVPPGGKPLALGYCNADLFPSGGATLLLIYLRPLKHCDLFV